MQKNKRKKDLKAVKELENLDGLIHKAREKMRVDLEKEQDEYETFSWGFKKGFLRAFELMLEMRDEGNTESTEITD